MLLWLHCSRNGYPCFRKHPVKNQPADKDRAEQRCKNTNDQCCSKTLDRSCSERIQDNTKDKRSDVGVDDRRISVFKSIANRQPDSLTQSKFFTYTFKDQDVRIYWRPMVNTIPAIPGSVSTAPNEARIPMMKNTLANNAMSATRPALL